MSETRRKEKARNLLVVAFHYPPDNTSTGVLRTLKFTEYLPRHAWQSHVVSVPETLYASRDPVGLDRIPPGVAVDRAWACDIKSAISIAGRYPGWLAVPDRYWPWLPTGAAAGARAILHDHSDAMLTTCPIPTAHLIGLRLKDRFGIPWLADFRDPWVEASMPRWRQRLEGGMERAVVSRADRVICNTPAMQRAFLKTYPDADPSKFVTITNGYDEADLAPITPEPASRFQILYPGVIDNENRNPRGLLQGVRRALDNGWLSERDLLISFLGAGPYGASEPFRRDVKESRLEGSVDVTVDRIPYGKALARMAGADVVVVLSDSLADASVDGVQSWTAMQVPAKLYEYLRLGRPLLALVSDGAVAELLETTGASVPVSPQDVAEVALALKQLYESRRPVPTRVPPANAAISSYSREQLTVALAAQLDALVRRTTIAR